MEFLSVVVVVAAVKPGRPPALAFSEGAMQVATSGCLVGGKSPTWLLHVSAAAEGTSPAASSGAGLRACLTGRVYDGHG